MSACALAGIQHLDVIFFKNLPFHKSPLWRPFLNYAFSVTVFTGDVCTVDQTGETDLRFQTKTDGCVWKGPENWKMLANSIGWNRSDQGFVSR